MTFDLLWNTWETIWDVVISFVQWLSTPLPAEFIEIFKIANEPVRYIYENIFGITYNYIDNLDTYTWFQFLFGVGIGLVLIGGAIYAILSLFLKLVDVIT